MPIRFRCGYCNRLLGIARRKAGTETTCPHCGYTLTVPDDPAGDTTELEDLDELLNPHTLPAPQTHQPAGESNNAVAQPKHQTKDAVSNGHAHSSSGPTSTPAPTSTRSTKAPTSNGSASSSAPDTQPLAERPLFEGNLEDVLGTHTPIDESMARSTHVPTSGMDVLSLENEQNHIVLSVQKATILAILVVILIGISFAAGFLLASSK